MIPQLKSSRGDKVIFNPFNFGSYQAVRYYRQ